MPSPSAQFFLIGSLVLLPQGVFAARQDNSAHHLDAGSARMLSSSDTQFALKAAQDGAAEVRLGKLAAEKASDPSLKAFGQQMVDDHTKANEQLKAVAQSEKMTLPSTLAANDQTFYDRLNQLSGIPFDKAYTNRMLKDHEMDVKEFQKEGDKGKDPAIKNFAAQTLPTLQEHLDKIKAIHSKMGSNSAPQSGQTPK